MIGKLEQVWSDALDTEAAAQARDDAAGVWQSFVHAFGVWNERTGEMAKGLGVDRIMEKFPLDDAGLARLELKPSNLAWQYYQLQVASIYAMQNFVQSLEGLTNPTDKRVHLFAGGRAELETWWEAGAFSIIRLRAMTLAKLLREQEACVRELAEGSEIVTQVPDESSVSRPAWADPLSAAGTLVSRGWHTAALPYLLLALRSVLAEAADLTNEELPSPLAPRLEAIPSLSSLARPVSILEEAVKLVGEGKEPNIGVTIPLAEEFGRRIQEMTLNPPNREVLSALTSAEGTADG